MITTVVRRFLALRDVVAMRLIKDTERRLNDKQLATVMPPAAIHVAFETLHHLHVRRDQKSSHYKKTRSAFTEASSSRLSSSLQGLRGAKPRNTADSPQT